LLWRSHINLHPAVRQVLLYPGDVTLVRRVGSGSAGEVFEATCLGARVAVKNILNITPQTLCAFRAEILLSATLRHPNIVYFVGACWGKELTCLVLEWVPSIAEQPSYPTKHHQTTHHHTDP